MKHFTEDELMPLPEEDPNMQGELDGHLTAVLIAVSGGMLLAMGLVIALGFAVYKLEEIFPG